jgi:hypothetical protein
MQQLKCADDRCTFTSIQERNVASTAPRKKPVEKDPAGGLTAAGRKAYKDKEGANLQPGVKGPADTPEKMKRKGSFLRRHYANLRGPLVGDDGKPTRLSLQAQAWGEPAPKTEAAAAKLAEKGSKLLERYHQEKEKEKEKEGKKSGAAKEKPQAAVAKRTPARKTAAKSTA